MAISQANGIPVVSENVESNRTLDPVTVTAKRDTIRAGQIAPVPVSLNISSKLPAVVLTPNQNQSLTISPKGLNKGIRVIRNFIIEAQKKTNQILYGKNSLPTDSPVKGLQKFLDKGIINVLKDFATIDFCNLTSYLLNANRASRSFNPDKPPQEGGLSLTLWRIQRRAYNYQKLIDKYYAQYGTSTGQDSRLGLSELIIQVNLGLNELLNAQDGLGNAEFAKTFPVISPFINYANNARDKFNTYTNVRAIPVEEVQDVLKYIDDIKEYLSIIQNINDPTVIVSVADQVFGGKKVKEDIQKLNQWIGSNLNKTQPSIKGILQQTKNINDVGQKILGYINLARTFIRIMLLLIRVFYIIRKFLFAIPIPNIFIVQGVTTFSADIAIEKVGRKGIARFVDVLNQLNATLGLIYGFVVTLIVAINEVLNYLRLISLNLQSCNPELAEEINNTIAETEKTQEALQNFINQINEESKNEQEIFGNYTIKIVTEEVTDEGISLRRRYGIAVDQNKNIVAQSTPTFASLDLIIINEVKALLVSKNLVNIGLSDLSLEDSQTILSAIRFLGDEKITIEDATFESIDFQKDSELSNFVDNLPGGRALRARVRDSLINQNAKLVNDLKTQDPNSEYSQSIIKQKESETNRLKIEKLEDQKKDLQRALLLAAANPIGASAIIAKIKAIDNELKALKNNQK